MAVTSALDEIGPAGGWLRSPARAMGSVYRAHYRLILGSAGIILFLAFWQWAGTSGVSNPLFTSSPTRVIQAFFALAAKGELGNDIIVSGEEFLIGFGLALVVGIPLGIVMGWYKPLEALLDPLVNFFNATPRVALLPLMIIWLGIGPNSKIAIIFAGAVFSILINTISGVKNLDETILKAAHSFGATDVQIFRTVALPGSVPFILTGMRLGLAHALVGVVVGELYASTAGLGHLIAIAGNTFQTDKMFVGVVIIAMAGLTFTALFARIESHFQSWKPQRG
ncbi:MAG TPA: ABC transporter permease [Dehalococcoidia bacterium]|nr:ABC transporter permease [Dehalococcoidia bacterium]